MYEIVIYCDTGLISVTAKNHTSTSLLSHIEEYEN